MSIVKRQHYVWRHYLRPWSHNESIWTYFKTLGKIERPSLMGVAEEKYFYKLIDFTDKEEDFLKKYIDKFSPEAVKDLNFDFLKLFTSTSKLKEHLGKNSNPAVDKEKVAEEIKKLEINLMEYAHGKMEALGIRLLQYRNIEDLKTINQDDYIFDAIMFLCFQYMRTKSMRNSALKSFIGGPYEELAKKSWNILSYVTATTLAKNISLDTKLKFTFIENYTTNHFVTCDQPVFNILNDKLDKQGEVIGLELYYPITPNHALTIHFRAEQKDKFEGISADNAMVEFLNKKVFENSEFYLFADTKELLEKIAIDQN